MILHILCMAYSHRAPNITALTMDFFHLIRISKVNRLLIDELLRLHRIIIIFGRAGAFSIIYANGHFCWFYYKDSDV